MPALEAQRGGEPKISRTKKDARGKLEVPKPGAMPCKIPVKSSGKPNAVLGKRKTKCSCVGGCGKNGKTRKRFRHGSRQKSETKKVIEEARNDGKKVHFASLMDL